MKKRNQHRKFVIIGLLIICIMASGSFINAMSPVNTEKSSINSTIVKIIGKGRTFAEAMRNAKAKLPRGKSYFAVKSKKDGDYYYVMLLCRW